MNELALFAGAVGGILGGKLLGWQIVCAVELDAYAASVLAQRQNDRLLEPFPIWSDIRSFDGRPWRGIVDVISGGFPCQDISAAGKGAGIKGKRSGLWVEMARIIDEVRPRFVFVENSPILTSRGLDRVLGDLAEMGYDARWGVLGAVDVGAPHKRDRIWIIANTIGQSLRSETIENVESEITKRSKLGLHGGNRNVANTSGQRSGRWSESTGWEARTEINRHNETAAFMANAESERAGNVSQNIRKTDRKIDTPNNTSRHCRGIDWEERQTMANTTSQRPLPTAHPGIYSEKASRRPWHEQPERCCCNVSDTDRARLEKRESECGNNGKEFASTVGANWWTVEPGVGRVAHGVANRVDRLRCIGNGQVPQCAAEAWRLLSKVQN